MQQHIYYIRYALRFADMQIPEFVTVFNAQVQSRGWSSMCAYHNQALLDEFQSRGIDTIAVYDGRVILFAHSVRYELPDIKLIAINQVSNTIQYILPLSVCSWHRGSLFMNYSYPGIKKVKEN